MRILVACEESQAVTIELRKLGHEAYSCDLFECSGNHPEWHFQQDVTELLKQKWDMIIAFPPCTDLAVSGAAHFKRKIANGSQQKSIDFFMMFVNSDCDKIAIENPIGIMSNKYKKPNQIVQPYFFGDAYKKSTCLWLKGLPELKPTNIVDPVFIEYNSKKTKSGKSKYSFMGATSTVNNNIKAKKMRSKTPNGLAKAMAEQWAGNNDFDGDFNF